MVGCPLLGCYYIVPKQAKQPKNETLENLSISGPDKLAQTHYPNLFNIEKGNICSPIYKGVCEVET